MPESEQESTSQVQIGFRGTPAYRTAVQKAALNRGMKVQQMLERAVDLYLNQTGSGRELDSEEPTEELEIPLQPELAEKAVAAAERAGVDISVLVAYAVEQYIGGAESIPISDEARVAENRSDESRLSDDQRDILAMLGEDPDKDFLFSSIQTTVQHALEQYRRKWKPQTKAPRQGETGKPQRRSTGTR